MCPPPLQDGGPEQARPEEAGPLGLRTGRRELLGGCLGPQEPRSSRLRSPQAGCSPGWTEGRYDQGLGDPDSLPGPKPLEVSISLLELCIKGSSAVGSADKGRLGAGKKGDWASSGAAANHPSLLLPSCSWGKAVETPPGATSGLLSDAFPPLLTS